MKNRILLSILFLFVGINLVQAQGMVRLQLRDSVSGEAIIGATIVELGSQKGAMSNENGFASFNDLKFGKLSFRIQSIEYSTKIFDLNLISKDTLIIVFIKYQGEELEEVMISSSRTNSRIENTPNRVEVLGTEELKEENGIKPGNITSLLGDIAGVQLQQVSASTGNTFARIQGMNGRYTQILRDGIPMFSGLSGSFGIMQIPPLDLKQIEVIRGPVSTLYGGGAIGGIINLINKEPEVKPEFLVSVNQTTLKETNVNLYMAKRYKKLGFSIFTGNTSQKQIDIDHDGLSDVPKVGNYIIHPRIVFYLDSINTLTLNYTGTFENRLGGDMRVFTTLKNDTMFRRGNNSNRQFFDIKNVSDFGKNGILIFKFCKGLVKQTLEINFDRALKFSTQQDIYFSELSYLKKHQKADWVIGVNVNSDRFQDFVAIESALPYHNFTIGTFVQNTWRPTLKFTIESGIRVDINSGSNGLFDEIIPLPRLALLYKFTSDISMRLNGGYGYKMPNPFSFYDIETVRFSGRLFPALNSEIAQGINTDINLHHLYKNHLSFTINQSFFYTRIINPIYNTSTISGEIELKNATNAMTSSGFQTYIRIKQQRHEVYFGYIFVHLERKYDGVHPTPSVTPKHNLSATYVFELTDSWHTGIESSFIAGQLDQNYLPVKSYLLLAAMVRYEFKKLTFVLNGENLLDFRQSKFGRIYDGTIYNPQFHQLWAPIDGRVINISVRYRII